MESGADDKAELKQRQQMEQPLPRRNLPLAKVYIITRNPVITVNYDTMSLPL